MNVASIRRRRVLIGIRYTVLIAAAVVLCLPFVYMISTSFKPNAFVLQVPLQFFPDDPTTANYTEAWGANHFARYFANSLYVAASTTLCTLALSSLMAFAFARLQFPGKRLLFGVLLVGLMVPTMVLIIPQFVLAKHLNMLDSLSGLVFFYVGGSLALNTFLLRGFFERIPRELDEAMTMDGAGPWRRYLHLALPLGRPALATVAIFSFLAGWDEYVWALTVINDPEKRTLPIGIALFQGEHSTSWGLVFAASIIAVVPVIVVYVFFQRHFVRGLTSGAVKS